MTDYQRHLQLLEEEMRDLRHKLESSTGEYSSTDLHSSLFYREFQLDSLTGDLARLRPLNEAIAAFVPSSSGLSDLWLVQAYVALKLHRFADAEQLLRADPTRLQCSQGRLVQADVDVQRGRYTAAREAIAIALAEDTTWDGLARSAHLTGMLGDFDAADALYLGAQDELTVKQMNAYAWIEVQRGVMDFQRGLYPQALAHYNHAAKAYSGYWLIEDRIAEVEGASGMFAEAVAKYEGLYERHQRAEWAHALGDLHSLAGDMAQAHEWKMKALDKYLASVASGEVHYYHYLIDLCCELPGQGEEALKWAEKDLAIRDNYQTRQNLAWALYRCGRIDPATASINKALESGVVNALLYLYAACIYESAGAKELSKEYARRMKAISAVPPRARVSFKPAASLLRHVPQKTSDQPAACRITSAAFSPII